MSTKKGNFLIHGSILAVTGIISRIIGLLYRMPLERIVGPEGMAYYSNAYEIYNLFLLLSTYSMPVAVSKVISAFEAKKQYTNSNRTFKLALIISLVLGGSFATVLFVFAKPIATMLGWPSIAIPLRILAPTIFVFALAGTLRGLFQGKKNMIPTSVSQLLEQIVNAVCSVVAAILLMNSAADNMKAVMGAAGSTLGTLAGAVFALLFMLFVYLINREFINNQVSRDRSYEMKSDPEILKMLIFTMLPILLSQTLYQVSGIIDSAMFGNILDGKGIAESVRAVYWNSYSNKYRLLSNVPVAIATAFSVTIVPNIAGNFAEGRLDIIREKISSAIKLNMIIAIPAAFGFMALAKPLLTFMFKDSTELSANVLKLGSIAVVFFAYSTLTNGILQGISKVNAPVIHAAISLAVHVVLNYVLLSFFNFGAYGLTIGNITYAFLVSVLNWRKIRVELDYRQELKTSFFLPLAAAAVMGLAAFGTYHGLILIIRSNTICCIVSVIVAVVVYFAVLILIRGLTKEEILEMPGGRTIFGILQRVHLIK